MRFTYAAAATTIVGAAAHLVVAALSLGTSPILSLVLLAMAAWCVLCGRELWQFGTRRCWLRATAGGAAMIVVHIGMMALSAGHEHGLHLGGLMTFAMGVTVGAELLLVVGSLAGLGRARST